ILFQLLTGTHPFAGEPTSLHLVMAHVNVPPPDVRTRAGSVPEALAALVARCLAKAPAERPSAAELARELGHLADAEDGRSLDALEREGLLRPCDGHDGAWDDATGSLDGVRNEATSSLNGAPGQTTVIVK